jgi:hypothetical protein
VVLKNNYLSSDFASPSPGMRVLVLWPKGSTATRESDGKLHVTGRGLPEQATGDDFPTGGGFEDLTGATRDIGTSIPPACQVGSYWIATPTHS